LPTSGRTQHNDTQIRTLESGMEGREESQGVASAESESGPERA